MKRTAIILGAGISGTLTALRLAKAGWEVTLLEAAHVGAGSSSRTAAGIRQQFSTPETILGMRYSVSFYKEFCAEVGGAECPIRQNGYLFLQSTLEEVEAARRRVALQRRCGLTEVELLEGEALFERFPHVNRLSVLGATWCPTDGFLRPELIYNEAAAAAVRAGVTLLQHAPVTAAERDATGRLTAVHTPKGRFEASLFIDATNAWSDRTSAILGAAPLGVLPMRRYLWTLEQAGSLAPEALAQLPLTIAPSGAYCRPENAHTLLMGWAHPAEPEPGFSYDDQDTIEPAFFHKSGADSYAYSVWASLAEVIPALESFAGLTGTTSGFYAVPPDHNPYLSYDPSVPNLIRLVGFSGHGAMFGPFTALVALALAEAGQNIDSVTLFGQSVSLLPFRCGREFHSPEHLVI